MRAGDAKAQVDANVLHRVAATQCALSRQQLAAPVVSDALGRLYNKDSVLKYLLARSSSNIPASSGVSASATDVLAGHLRGLKDVRELKLTPNPAFRAEQVATQADDNDAPTPFVCPLNQRPMNGRHRFLYLVPCGCVMSESGLRATLSEEHTSGKNGNFPPNGGEKGSKSDSKSTAACPVCGTAFRSDTLGKRGITPGDDVVVINGTDDEVEAMRRAMEAAREREKARKKELKATAAATATGNRAPGKDATQGGAAEDDTKRRRHEEKRKRKEEVARILEEEKAEQAKRRKATETEVTAGAAPNGAAPNGKEMSAALRSLYGYDRPKQKESWMTRGTFNRFA